MERVVLYDSVECDVADTAIAAVIDADGGRLR